MDAKARRLANRVAENRSKVEEVERPLTKGRSGRDQKGN